MGSICIYDAMQMNLGFNYISLWQAANFSIQLHEIVVLVRKCIMAFAVCHFLIKRPGATHNANNYAWLLNHWVLCIRLLSHNGLITSIIHQHSLSDCFYAPLVHSLKAGFLIGYKVTFVRQTLQTYFMKDKQSIICKITNVALMWQLYVCMIYYNSV